MKDDLNGRPPQSINEFSVTAINPSYINPIWNGGGGGIPNPPVGLYLPYYIFFFMWFRNRKTGN